MAEPIAYQSALPELLKMLAGNKTGLSSTTSSTQSNTANIDPLTMVFNQALAQGAMSSADMQQLITSIFQEGARQVPVLTQQFANATGSRVSSNSGLQLALGDLNRTLSTDAAKAVLSNQQAQNQIAQGAAGNIANATKQTTTAENKTASQTQTPTSNSMNMMLGGFLLNQLDKKGYLDWAKLGGSSVAPNVTLPTAPTPSEMQSYNGPVAVANSNFSGDPYNADAVVAPDTSNLPAVGGDLGFDFGSFDVANGIDGGGLADGFAGAIVDPGMDFSTVPDINFFGDGFFKNGGVVRAPVRGYADGGVVRNVNNMGSRVSPVGTTALAVNPAQLIQQAASPASRSYAAPARQQLQDSGVEGSGGVGAAPAGGIGTTAQNAASVNGMAALGISALSGIPSVAVNATLSALGIPNMSMSPVTQAINAITSAFAPDPMSVAAQEANANNEGIAATGPDPAAAVAAANAAEGISSADGFNAGFDGFDGDTAGESGESTGEATGEAASGGESAGTGNGEAGGTFKNGGLVKGPGTSTSDSIRVAAKDPGAAPIRYSANEFVIPAEVVRVTGTGPWEQLIAAFNRPKA